MLIEAIYRSAREGVPVTLDKPGIHTPARQKEGNV